MSRWHMIVDCSIMPRWQYSWTSPLKWPGAHFLTPLVVHPVGETGSGRSIYRCWHSWFPYYILILYQWYVVLICWSIFYYTWFSCWASAHGYVVDPQVLAGDGLTDTSTESVERLYMWGHGAAEKHRGFTMSVYVVLSLDDYYQMISCTS